MPCLVHCLQSLFSSFVKGSNCMSARLCWFSSFFRLHSYSFFFLSFSLCWIRRWLRCCSETPDSFHFSQSRFSSSFIGSALSVILSSFKRLYSLVFYHHFLFCSLRRFVRKKFYPSPVQRAVLYCRSTHWLPTKLGILFGISSLFPWFFFEVRESRRGGNLDL